MDEHAVDATELKRLITALDGGGHMPGGFTHVPVDALQPHPENARLYGDEPLDDLADSVRVLGVRVPLLITPEHLIVSGHRRWRAAQAAGLATVPVIVLAAADDLAVLEQLVHLNRQRERTFTQKAREARLLQEVERRRAERRQRATRFGPEPAVENLPPPGLADAGKTRDRVGAYLGVSGRTADKVLAVVDAIDRAERDGDTQTAARLTAALDGKRVDRAYREVRDGGTAPATARQAPAGEPQDRPLAEADAAWRQLRAAVRVVAGLPDGEAAARRWCSGRGLDYDRLVG